MCSSIVESVTKGMNGTVFAYGQTSSGKTYTMQGDADRGVHGIVQKSTVDIFKSIASQKDRAFTVKVSYIEIYNEHIRDLLKPSSTNIKIREERVGNKGNHVESHEEEVYSLEDMQAILQKGEQHRHTAGTNMNAVSSRSHTIIRISVESTPRDKDKDSDDADSILGDEVPPSLLGSLSLVDLAGSESVKHTLAEGERLREGANINKSLLALSTVIARLSDAGSSSAAASCHINFRDSKLTRILKPSLVGNTKTAIVVCCTPAATYTEETRSSLRFANRAKTLKTKVKVNKVMSDARKVVLLQKELNELRKSKISLLGSLPTLHDDSPTLKEQLRALKEEKEKLNGNLEVRTLAWATEKNDVIKVCESLTELISFACVQGRVQFLDFIDEMYGEGEGNKVTRIFVCLVFNCSYPCLLLIACRVSNFVIDHSDEQDKEGDPDLKSSYLTLTNIVLEHANDKEGDDLRDDITAQDDLVTKMNSLHNLLLHIVNSLTIVDSISLMSLFKTCAQEKEKVAQLFSTIKDLRSLLKVREREKEEAEKEVADVKEKLHVAKEDIEVLQDNLCTSNDEVSVRMILSFSLCTFFHIYTDMQMLLFPVHY